MRTLLLYFVVALFAWMGFALFGGSGDTPLAPGFLLLMAALSVVLWDRFVAPRQVASATHVSAASPTCFRNAHHRARRKPTSGSAPGAPDDQRGDAPAPRLGRAEPGLAPARLLTNSRRSCPGPPRNHPRSLSERASSVKAQIRTIYEIRTWLVGHLDTALPGA